MRGQLENINIFAITFIIFITFYWQVETTNMCPCVLLEKLKRVVGGQKREKKDATSPSNSGGKTGDSNGDDSKTSVEAATKTTKKSLKKEATKKARKKENQASSTDNSGPSLSSDPSKSYVNVNTVEKLGQVICNKPDPKDFVRRVLESERPDLFEKTELQEREYLTIENYLVQQGEVRIGVDIHLGNLTGCDNESSKVGEGDSVTIVQMYANGRFGAVYLVQRDVSGKSLIIPKGLALKTWRRLGSTTKLEEEIRILRRLCRQDKATDLKDVPRITHITPMFFNGVSGGAPYMVMPMMDANLTKIRQETGYKWPWTDAFYIAQEAMLGIRQCHEHSIVHRDIKPTNLLLNSTDNKTWWLCDFGDACRVGEKKKLSAPDALTLPFVSRAGHQAMKELIPATIGMDIESWFYMLLELFIALPWNSIVEEKETLEAKNAFWTSLTPFFEKYTEKLPPQISQIARIVADSSIAKPHAQLQALLREGFNKYNVTPPWKPHWAEKRPVKIVQMPAKQEVNMKIAPKLTPTAATKNSAVSPSQTQSETSKKK